MTNQETAQEKKEHAEPQGYYRHNVGKGIFLFLSLKEKHEAQERQGKTSWNDKVRGWVRRAFHCMRRYSTVIIMLATVANLWVASLQWGAMIEETRANRDAADTARQQAKVTTAALKATQRAAVILGLPDGKFIDFVTLGGQSRVMLYFRNYGAMTARNTKIDMWPITVPLGTSATVVSFPPVPGGEPYPGIVGLDLPPGFQHTEYFTPSANFREVADTGQVFVKLVGRLSYVDEFGSHCNTFSAFYKPEVQSFRLQAARNELCDGRPHTVLFCHSGIAQLELDLPDGRGWMECPGVEARK